MVNNYWVIRFEDAYTANFIASFPTLEKARKNAKERDMNKLSGNKKHHVVKTYRK